MGFRTSHPERAVDHTCRLVEGLRSYGAPGVHLFVTDTTAATQLVARLVFNQK